MSVVVFGDVHGNATGLKRTFEYWRSRIPDVQFLTVGDLIDRGPDSKGVIELCIEYKVSGVIGNHELWALNLIEGSFDSSCLHKIMGGKATLNSYGFEDYGSSYVERNRLRIPKEHRDFFHSLVLSMSVETEGKKYLLTHGGVGASIIAGIKAGMPEVTDTIALDALLRGKPDIILWTSPLQGRKEDVHPFQGMTQVFGHYPLAFAIHKPGWYIALDTGSGTKPPFRLSSVLLGTDEIVAF